MDEWGLTLIECLYVQQAFFSDSQILKYFILKKTVRDIIIIIFIIILSHCYSYSTEEKISVQKNRVGRDIKNRASQFLVQGHMPHHQWTHEISQESESRVCPLSCYAMLSHRESHMTAGHRQANKGNTMVNVVPSPEVFSNPSAQI